MWLTAAVGVAAGREPFGFPKKIAYIVTQEHGGKEDDGYGGFGNDYFNFTMERRGYLIHTATGEVRRRRSSPRSRPSTAIRAMGA